MKNYKKILTPRYLLLAFSSLFPVVSFAALDGIKGLLTAFGGILKSLIPIIFGLAIVYFFWGIGQFILHADDQKTREDGKKKIVWGIIALFVMLSIYGIIHWIGVIFGISQGGDMSDIFNIP